MKLRVMAISNIKHNFRKYALYFFSLCFSVFTAYAFLGLMQNKSVAAAFNTDTRYQAMLIAFGVIIGVFVFFFMINSNQSFIRARKKEISTYALFGMTNGKIGKLLFLETMIVGTAALVIGIGLSIFFSKFVAMILIKMTVSEFSGKVLFSIDVLSILATIGIFFIFFCVLGLSGLFAINRFELVDLFKAEKSSEGNPKGSWIILFISMALIAGGYFLASNSNSGTVINSTITILALVISGTYFFFWGGLPKVLNIIKKNKKSYYKATNLVAVTSFAHRIRSVGFALATIAVLSAVATTAIATGFTLYANTEKNAYESIGYDLYFYGNQEKVLDDIYKAIEKHGAKVTEEQTVQRYFVDPIIEPVIIGERHYFAEEDVKLRIYSESVYNNLLSISKYDYEIVDIKDTQQAAYVMPYLSDELEKAMMGKEIKLGETSVEVSQTQKCMYTSFGAWHTLVIEDNLFDELLAAGHIKDSYEAGDKLDRATVINYTKSMSMELSRDLNKILSGNTSYRIAYNHYSEGLRIFGLVRFIGFFMSAVVILMTASMLYFKQIMAAEEERHLYRILRKLGMDAKLQQKVIVKRLFPVFLIPLLVGIIHSIFAMKSADTMVFSNMISGGNSYLTVLGFSSVMYGAYAIVYGIFYLITKSQYIRTINR